jgi:CSLREA domain-containing protein
MKGKTPRWPLSLVCCLIVALPICAAATAATITVTSPNDATANDGVCTLREAIVAANTNAPSGAMAGECAAGASGLDTIDFDITGGCATVCTITLLSSPLPTVSEPVIIDGYSQTGASANTLAVGDNAVLKIEIDGISAGNAAGGLININASGSTVKGLVINRGGAGNSAIRSIGSNTVITGNFLGTDATGTLGRGNNVHGVLIAGGTGSTIGGTAPAARNVISGNKLDGIVLSSPSTDNTVQGNYVGTNASGTAAIGNEEDGIELANAASNLIGGTTTGAGNVISGNGFRGIFITTGLATGNMVQGNFIGTDATGTIALANTLGGVSIANNASNNVIGGTTSAARNVISGNAGFGIEIHGFSGNGATGNVVQGNYIGIDASGTGPLGNSGDGVHTTLLANSNPIGGAAPGAGNTIAFNGGIGVGIGSGAGNTILGNSVFSNGGLGVDLGFNGVTPNDSDDGDTGPNNLQNSPVITTAFSGGGSTTIQGTLNSAPSADYQIDFYSNSSCDPSTYGEGQTYLGHATATTDGSGNASFTAVLPGVSVSPQARLTATATDPNGDTSEFSACISLQAQYHTVTPCRLADTRKVADAPALSPGPDRTFVIGGKCFIPADAQAVAFNFTITQPTAAGDLRIFPGGFPLQFVSTMNYGGGQTRANNAVVALGPGGVITVHVDQASGIVHFIIDVSGYFR